MKHIIITQYQVCMIDTYDIFKVMIVCVQLNKVKKVCQRHSSDASAVKGQVISKSRNPRQVTRSQGRSQNFLWVHSFLKKVDTFFSRRPKNTGCQRRWLFHCNK